MSALADAGPNRQSILLGVASTAALASALWIFWPRRPKASHDTLLLALQHLRAESAAVYAEVSAAVARAALPPTLATTSLAAAASSDADNNDKEDGLQKLKQVLEQPLVLESALRQASDHAASELWAGGTANDLELTLQDFANDPEVRQSVEDIHAMHQACLAGERATSREFYKSKEMWSEEEVLEMLRVLGHAKCAQLEVLRTCFGNQENAAGVIGLGAQIIDACEQAESNAWESQFGNDSRTRRCLFRLALESYSMERSFSDRRVALESELEDSVVAVSKDLMTSLLS